MKYILLLIPLLFSCSNLDKNEIENSCGYVTCNDPLRIDCRDNIQWIVNNSGEVNMGEECGMY